MNHNWISAVLNRPVVIIVLALLVVLGSSVGNQYLYLKTDYKVYFEEDNPQRVAFEEMQAVFSKNETANIVIAPQSGDVFNPRTMQLIKELTDEAWQTPYSTRVDSITNYQHTWAEGDDMLVEDLILEVEMINAESLDRARDVSLSEPNLVNRLVSEQGHVAMIAITVTLSDEDNSAKIREVAESVRQLTNRFAEQYPDHAFHHTGMVFLNNAFASEAENDGMTLIPAMFGAVIVMLLLLLRSFTGMVTTVVIVAASIATTMGLAGWMGYFISTATVNVPILVMTLAVADSVHVISTYMYALRKGQARREALAYSLKLNFSPILITSVTTAIGFLTLNFSDVPVLADLGNLTAIGVLFAFVLSVTLLPALLMVMPLRVSLDAEEHSDAMTRLAEWVISRHRWLLPLSVMMAALAVLGSFQNQINDIATEYFDTSTTFRQASDFQQDNLSGMMTLDLAIYSDEESGLNTPDMINVVGEFSAWLREQPDVDHVSTIADTYRRLNKNMNADNPEFYLLPQDQELAAQYLLMYEMSLPFGLDINNQINLDKSATRIVVTMQNKGSKEFTRFEANAMAWMAENAPQYRITAGSPALMFAHIGETNMSSMLRGTVLALVLISGLLIFALRSWRMGLVSLLPNLLPAAIGFGIWGVFSSQVNLGLSVVLSMVLGIIVDDTVHFLSKYRHARADGSNAEDSVRYAFASVGRALWVTTLVLSVGFSMLTFSSFALNADMGLLTGIIIVVALAVDFLFLPAFLLFFDGGSDAEEDSNAKKRLSPAH